MPTATAITQLTGRAAQREQTRRRMLQAVLDIIVRDGMRAVRQRAVADLAGVSLGTTTYHFKTVEALIVSAFQYWRESIPLGENPFYQKLTELLGPFNERAVNADCRFEVAQQIHVLSVAYICDQLRGKNQDRIVELAFYHESLRSQALRELVLQSWQTEMEHLTEVHRIVGSTEPVEDARITLSLFRQLEQSAVIADLPEPDTNLIEVTLRRHFSLCFGVEISPWDASSILVVV